MNGEPDIVDNEIDELLEKLKEKLKKQKESLKTSDLKNAFDEKCRYLENDSYIDLLRRLFLQMRNDGVQCEKKNATLHHPRVAQSGVKNTIIANFIEICTKLIIKSFQNTYVFSLNRDVDAVKKFITT